jgi:NAD(P) transhydrogenase subunit beta
MNEYVDSGIQLAYLGAASLFILGLKQLGSPATARRGNLLAALGMFVAVVATLLYQEVLNYQTILIGIAIGAGIGAIAAQKVEMTAMPQMVGLFNGLGGAASALVASGEFWQLANSSELISPDTNFTILLSIFIGGVTFSGSLIAFSKLQRLLPGAPLTFPLQQPFNLTLLGVFLAGSAYLLFFEPGNLTAFAAIAAVSLVLGIMFVLPIGGGDMPVVISLLNSFSGLAASAAGFVIKNNMLIIAGALVGASGIILTVIMCKAMNRSLTSVLFGAFGASEGTAAATSSTQKEKTVRSLDAEEAAMMLGYARSVVIVPGYGMAVAQAQHSVQELVDLLEKKGVEVKYAIHPVAGRMPGHMNVLLAEANVPYPQLYDMEDINPQFGQTDVALVIGANDVVNPAAREQQDSPIYGMPILNVDTAKNTIVIKRSLSTGFAGIDNDLFYRNKTFMMFGSAKDMVTQLVNEVKQL